MQQSYIRQLSLFHESDAIQNLSNEEKGYAILEDANNLIFSNPLAFVLGLIFDQSMKSSIAWASPLFLKERLGHLDVKRIAKLDENDLRAIVAQRSALHRYPGVVARYIIASCNTIVSDFSGNASNIWKGQSCVIEVKRNLLSLKGVGEKKANLAIMMLARDFNVQFDDLDVLPLAMDIHLQRVIDRSGLFNIKTQNGVKELHENLKEQHPLFPAVLGTSIWYIGRHYCHEILPECGSCPVALHCHKRINHE